MSVMTMLRDIVRKKYRPSVALKTEMEHILSRAYSSGAIKVIYDIGAHKGRWAAYVHKLMPKARLVLFEANPLHRPELTATGFEHYIGVLTKPGVSQVEFYSRADDDGSTGGSVYKENTLKYKEVDPVVLSSGTLEDTVASKKLPFPDLIKIDVQGAELDVIAGGEQIFKQAAYILMEFPIVEYNEKAPTFDNYISTLTRLGFLPIAVTEVHKKKDIVVQIDFLFCARKHISRESLELLNLV